MTGPGIWQQGEAYERYVGRWSAPVAHRFLDWLELPVGLAWLDVGCGTGVVCRAILESCDPRAVIGIDPSAGFLALARTRVSDPRASFEQGDARALPLADDAVDVAVSGLVLNFVPDHGKAALEMRRVVRPGGTVACYVWDYAGEMQLMRYFWEAAAALDPRAAALDEGTRSPICGHQPLADLLRGVGLEAVDTREIDVPTVFTGFDDYWTPFLGGQGPAPAYCMSLGEAQREALRERLRATLPQDGAGRIPLVARALAVRGRVAMS